jgi:hypothetical protein
MSTLHNQRGHFCFLGELMMVVLIQVRFRLRKKPHEHGHRERKAEPFFLDILTPSRHIVPC